jgi:hypothetical protein
VDFQPIVGASRSDPTELCASTRSEAPKPNTENGGDDKRDPAYAHWNGHCPDGDRSLLDQSDKVTNGKDSENNARDAQSSSLRVHGAIVVIASRFVSKNANLYLASPQGRRLHENTNDR